MKINKWDRFVKIAIKDLSLWDENARFPEEYFNKSEEELVSYFLNKKEFKIEEFAKEIVTELDIPQFEQILVYKIDGKNIVLEGNRRLAVYKLLSNPSLANNKMTQSCFENLKQTVNINDNFKLVAHITTNKEEGLRFVDRKHNKGNNEVGWGEPERRNFSVRRLSGSNKDILRVELSNLVKELNLPDQIKREVLGKGYVTTFYRIIDSIPSSVKLGYEVLKNGHIKIKDRKKFDDLLKIVVYNIWKKEGFKGEKINSRTLNKMNDIKTYFDSLEENDTIKVDNEIEKVKERNLFGEETFKLQKKGESIYKRVPEKPYLSIISPKLYLPNIKSEKIKEVFNEFKLIDVTKCPTAISALVRIIIDISVKKFLELKGHSFNSYGHLIIKHIGQKNKRTLKEKINYISDNYAVGDVKSAIVALNNDLLTQNLNQVMHNTIFLATETSIRDFWKNLKPVFDFLIKEIIKEESKK